MSPVLDDRLDDQGTKLQQALEARALALLALREHGDLELLRKLQYKIPESSPMQQQVVLSLLQVRGWQSNARFIETYVRHALEKGQGAYKIRQALSEKVSDQSAIEAELALDEADWVDIARRALHKKYGTLEKPKEAKEQAKRVRFLQSRGFSHRQIWRAFS